MIRWRFFERCARGGPADESGIRSLRRCQPRRKSLVRESDSDKADALFDQWANEEKQLIAPVFFEVETDSILRQKVALRNKLTTEQAEAAFARLRGLPIQQVSELGQRERASGIATGFGFATVYDATYLALAELRGCEFWTADERLFNQVKDKLFFVKWLGTHRAAENIPIS